MEVNEKVQLLRRVPIFQGLDDSDLRILAGISREVSIVTGSQVFNEGSVGDALFIIKYGTVRVIKKGSEEEEVVRMGSGQSFGEMALIENEKRSATVDTVEPTELLKIAKDELENFLAQDIALGLRVYKAFSRYLSGRLRQTTADLAFMREKARGH